MHVEESPRLQKLTGFDFLLKHFPDKVVGNPNVHEFAALP